MDTVSASVLYRPLFCVHKYNKGLTPPAHIEPERFCLVLEGKINNIRAIPRIVICSFNIDQSFVGQIQWSSIVSIWWRGSPSVQLVLLEHTRMRTARAVGVSVFVRPKRIPSNMVQARRRSVVLVARCLRKEICFIWLLILYLTTLYVGQNIQLRTVGWLLNTQSWSPYTRQEGVWGSGHVTQRILNFSFWFRWVVSFTFRPLNFRLKSHLYQLKKRLGERQRLSE